MGLTMFLKIIGGLATVLLIVFVAGFVLPSQVHVERSLLIDAPPAKIFPLVSDLNKWDAWSPWAEMDPNAEMTISGTGVGQTMKWHSEDPKVGNGSQQVIRLDPPHQMVTHLDFGQQGNADASLTLVPKTGGTLVSWSFDSDVRAGVSPLAQPISTYVGFLMDSLMGPEYEAGLNNLKQLAES